MAKEKQNTPNTAVMTADRQLLANSSEALASCLNQFGYKSSLLEHDGNTYQLTLKDVNGKGDIVKSFTVTDRIAKAIDDIAHAEDFGKMKNLIIAWNLKLVEPTVKKAGYNNVGDFAFLNYGMKANWANQLLNCAKAFLTEDENGPCFKYEWCKGVPFSNLALILPRINNCDGDTIDDKIADFESKYIVPNDDEASNVLDIAHQAELKKQLETLNESEGKTSKRKKKDDTSKPIETTPLTAIAILQSWLAEHAETVDTEFEYYSDALTGLEEHIKGSEALVKAVIENGIR